MKNFLILLLSPIIYLNSFAQCVIPSQYQGNTGSNMTVFLTPGVIDTLPLTSADPYVVALSGSGLVVGSASLAQNDLIGGQQSLGVWGDDSSTPEVDGALTGEELYFQLVDGNSLYDLDISFDGPNSYTTNAQLPAIAGTANLNCIIGCTAPWAENYNANATDDDGSCYLNGCKDSLACNYNEYATIDDGSCAGMPGCTDDSFAEYYNQEYIAGCDDGSCSKATLDLDINPSFFIEPPITSSNMTLGFSLNYPVLEGSIFGAFADLNNDGIIQECVGLKYFQNGFFAMPLWGDDSTTPETDGLIANQTDIIFAILNTNGNVIAFNPDPEFSGYTVNANPVFSNLDFDLTIYGCMDSSFCNYNEEAEEDDGSCAGIPGCTNNDYIEYNANASCELDGACMITWQSAYINETEISALLQASLDSAATAFAQDEAIDDAILEQTIADADALLAYTIDSAAIAFAQDEAIDNALLVQTIADANALLEQTIADADALLTYTLDSAAIAFAQDEAIDDALLEQAIAYADDLADEFFITEVNYQNQIANLEDSIANYTSPISIDFVAGWNIIGYTLDETQDAVASFEEIVEYIDIVKNNAAEVYWPEFSFNGIGDLIPGQGYQVKVTQAIEGFMYPDTNGQRIELSPKVPQWVIDMPVETHPNDIRTLVRTVNLLGQEIELDNTLKGTTIIFLYSDGTVEKKLY